MKVTLLHNTPLWINAHGARTCWDSGDKSDSNNIDECGSKDMELIDRVGNKFKHQSILEHVSYNFYIEGISRACLQELTRHRIASLSVKSTRYTLKELKTEKSFVQYDDCYGYADCMDRASKYLVFTGEPTVDDSSVRALEELRKNIFYGVSNDKAKYCMPEAYKTELTWTINMRSLQNFLSLRSDKSALWEIRNLANAVYEALPEDHKYMYDGYMKKEVTAKMRDNDFNRTGEFRSDEEIKKSAEEFTKYM